MSEEMLGADSIPDEDEGVVGKVVKVSILQQLQRFTKSPSTGSGIKLAKIQRQPQSRDAMVSGSGERDKGTPSQVQNIRSVFEPKGSELRINCSTAEELQTRATTLDEGALDMDVGNDHDLAKTPGLENMETDSELTDPQCTLNDASVSDCVATSSASSPSHKNVIRPINRDVVHQICSGQVIVTLSTAVKELVENSLDAGATKIDIRLVECGSKLIEVSDDAGGIDEVNFEGLALKHHTSKIAEFEDLGNLSTFGFRGEALSSLCALGNLTVITRHKDSGQRSGYKIEYDYRGHITSKIRCARDFGTTVVLKDLFHTLPVRHKEITKNLKKEYHRMVNVLYGYCLVTDGVRINCTNQIGNGAPQKVFAVPASNIMRERIVTLFGNKQLASLIEIKQPRGIPDEILAEFGLNESTFENKYEIEGYISKPNYGRSSNDRQFYFINSRPCDPAKISRVINEVYHTFSRQQNPFVCLHIKTSKENVDVNVTPDKRTVYVQNEKILLATVKASLVPLLTASAASFNPINSLSSQSQPTISFASMSEPKLDSKGSSSFCLSSSFEIKSDISNIYQKKTILNDSREGGFDPQFSSSTSRLSRSVIERTNSFIKSFSKGSSATASATSSSRTVGSIFKRAREYDRFQVSDEQKQPKLAGCLNRFEMGVKKSIGKHETHPDEIEAQDNDEEIEDSMEEDYTQEVTDNLEDSESDEEDEEVMYDDEIQMVDEMDSGKRKSVTIKIDWQSGSFKDAVAESNKKTTMSSSINYARKFRAKIVPEDNSIAEDELKKQLTQDMFPKMDIIGQFNLGFIVVKNGPDLFIVDQHASDEKYNYEDQEKSTVLNGQLLISPLDLELPAISENIIMDNIEVFRKNGFDFIISPNEEPRKRVKMLKIPFSKNIEFGKSDVEELIFMLEDAASEKCFYRPTKVREMFASRACRKSVMIGTALNFKEMRLIVDHMGEMNQPWNCPHGRPTIRHLINLNILPDLDLTKFNHYRQ